MKEYSEVAADRQRESWVNLAEVNAMIAEIDGKPALQETPKVEQPAPRKNNLGTDTIGPASAAEMAAIDAALKEIAVDSVVEANDKIGKSAAPRNDKIGTRKSGCDKIGTLKSRKSVICDGEFVADLRVSGYFEEIDGRASSVVYAPLNLPRSHSPSKPKPWRDIGDDVRGLFYHAAIKAKPNVRGYTLRLSKDVETAARGQGKGCLDWLHRRVVRHVKRAVGHPNGEPVPFWFAIEEDDRGSLHIHGEIAFDPSLEAAIRKALKGAGGAWEGEGRGNAQVRFESNPDFRWAGYCLKDVHKTRPARRRYMRQFGSPRWWVATFEGKPVTASENLTRIAKECHANAIKPVQAHRQEPEQFTARHTCTSL